MTTINSPMRFHGTAEQREANIDSHRWTTFDGEEYRCTFCDCKPWHTAAQWPCGVDVPRQDVTL